MGKIRVKLNRKALERIGQEVAKQYAKRHSGECAYCHKRIEPPAGMPEGMMPVCADCAKEHGLV